MQSETRLRTYLGVWVPMSRTGKGPFKALCVVFAISIPPHPHRHVLVLEDGFTDHDRFVYLPIGADAGMLKDWQAATPALSASPMGFYKGFELGDQLVAPLPPRRVQLVRRYGAYSGKGRNQRQRRSEIYHLAPESWKQAHQLRTSTNQEAKPAAADSTETPDAGCRSVTLSRLRRQS